MVHPLLLEIARNSSAPIGRRCINGLGDPRAIGPMVETLKDPNNLFVGVPVGYFMRVRRRLARDLLETNDPRD